MEILKYSTQATSKEKMAYVECRGLDIGKRGFMRDFTSFHNVGSYWDNNFE